MEKIAAASKCPINAIEVQQPFHLHEEEAYQLVERTMPAPLVNFIDGNAALNSLPSSPVKASGGAGFGNASTSSVGTGEDAAVGMDAILMPAFGVVAGTVGSKEVPGGGVQIPILK